MNCNSSNGRVDILGPNTSSVFALSDRIPISKGESFRDAMTGNWYDTTLSNAFFSANNIQILQNGLRKGVYQMSNDQYLIGEQSPDELKIIMRSVFLQNSKNLPNNISQQISVLNNIVLDYAVKQVYSACEGYMKYKRDASTLVVPIDTPVLSRTNDKQLILKKWF